jgi:alpha-amylase
MFLELIRNKDLKISYSFTGTLLEQLELWRPDVIDLYKELHTTGRMELICESYYHSLAVFYDVPEFVRQVQKHCAKLEELFGARPTVFRNTELAYRNDVGEIIRRLGFKGIFTEGWDKILDWRSPNFMYKTQPVELDPQVASALSAAGRVEAHAVPEETKLLLKNYRRSDDIAFRFQLKGWEGYPVTPEKFAQWVAAEPGYLTSLCMDYETVGEHHHADSGIFEFYKRLPEELAKHDIEFILPSEAIELFPAEEALSYPDIVSWADAERDLSAWSGNEMQQKSLEAIYLFGQELKGKLLKLPPERRKELLATWGKLQTSDHYYYMSTKYWSDGDVHKYFSPYTSPFEANMTFINILAALRSEILTS